MGNFEKLSVLVIVVIIVMILVVALYTWQDNGDDSTPLDPGVGPETGSEASIDESEPSLLDRTSGLGNWPDEFLDNTSEESDGGMGAEGAEGLGVDSRADSGAESGEETAEAGEGEGQPVEPFSEDEGDAADEPWTYIVKAGDTLSHISERELGTVRRIKEIYALNPGLDALKIRAGDQLKMPPRGRASSTSETASSGSSGASAGGATTARRGGSIPTGDYYVIQAGDRLQAIAKRAYGNMDRWPELWARNLSTIPSIDDPLPAGSKIFIPK